jgi:hypothetical protein
VSDVDVMERLLVGGISSSNTGDVWLWRNPLSSLHNGSGQSEWITGEIADMKCTYFAFAATSIEDTIYIAG